MARPVRISAGGIEAVIGVPVRTDGLREENTAVGIFVEIHGVVYIADPAARMGEGAARADAVVNPDRPADAPGRAPVSAATDLHGTVCAGVVGIYGLHPAIGSHVKFTDASPLIVMPGDYDRRLAGRGNRGSRGSLGGSGRTGACAPYLPRRREITELNRSLCASIGSRLHRR